MLISSVSAFVITARRSTRKRSLSANSQIYIRTKWPCTMKYCLHETVYVCDVVFAFFGCSVEAFERRVCVTRVWVYCRFYIQWNICRCVDCVTISRSNLGNVRFVRFVWRKSVVWLFGMVRVKWCRFELTCV